MLPNLLSFRQEIANHRAGRQLFNAITLFFLQMTYPVKFREAIFNLSRPFDFSYFFRLVTSKSDIWKLQAVVSLILLLAVVSLRSNDGSLERVIFDYYRSYIIFSIALYFARLFFSNLILTRRGVDLICSRSAM